MTFFLVSTSEGHAARSATRRILTIAERADNTVAEEQSLDAEVGRREFDGGDVPLQQLQLRLSGKMQTGKIVLL